MAKLTLPALGRMLAKKVEGLGLRNAAAAVDVSAATLSRVQRGYLPDLETFRKICRWLEVDPADVLGIPSKASPKSQPKVAVHFRKKQTLRPETARALSEMVLAAHRAWLVQEDDSS